MTGNPLERSRVCEKGSLQLQCTAPTFLLSVFTEVPVSQVSLTGILLSCCDSQFLDSLCERTEDLICVRGNRRWNVLAGMGCPERGLSTKLRQEFGGKVWWGCKLWGHLASAPAIAGSGVEGRGRVGGSVGLERKSSLDAEESFSYSSCVFISTLDTTWPALMAGSFDLTLQT